jgi:hypothetical protein
MTGIFAPLAKLRQRNVLVNEIDRDCLAREPHLYVAARELEMQSPRLRDCEELPLTSDGLHLRDFSLVRVQEIVPVWNSVSVG